MEKKKGKPSKAATKSVATKKSRNRLHNPFDGSQRPAQQEHKSPKDYVRRKKVKPDEYQEE